MFGKEGEEGARDPGPHFRTVKRPQRGSLLEGIPLRPFPRSFPGAGLRDWLSHLWSESCSGDGHLQSASSSRGPASTVPRAQGSIGAGAVGTPCQAEACIPYTFGLHGSKTKPRIVARARGCLLPLWAPSREAQGEPGTLRPGREVGTMSTVSLQGPGGPALSAPALSQVPRDMFLFPSDIG